MQRFLTSSALAAILYAASPATAQPVAQNRIEQIIICEGRRLAAASLATGRAKATAADAPWIPVRMVPHGAGVEVSARGTAPVQRVFVGADDTSITVLSPLEARLPRSAWRMLHDLARAQPRVLLLPDQSYLEEDLRLDHEGLWIGSRLLAKRTDLIERISRDDLLKLRVDGPGGTYWGRGLLVGMAAGALLAYGAGSRCGPGASDCTLSGMVFMPIGAGLGAAAGGIVGAAFSRPSAKVIYSAP